MYVFVDILIDLDNFVASFKLNFPDLNKSYYLMSTIQFNSSIFTAKGLLEATGYKISIPQDKPRCPGEVNSILSLESGLYFSNFELRRIRHCNLPLRWEISSRSRYDSKSEAFILPVRSLSKDFH